MNSVFQGSKVWYRDGAQENTVPGLPYIITVASGPSLNPVGNVDSSLEPFI